MKNSITVRNPISRWLLIPLILYIGLLVLAVSWLKANPASNWRVVVAMLPLIPGLFLALGVMRQVSALDELQRSIQVQGIVFSFAGTLILVTSYGLLGLAGVAQLNGIFVGLFMAVLWLVGRLAAGRKYA